MIPLLVAFQLAASTAQSPSSSDSATIVARLHENTVKFLATWRTNWQASEAARHELRHRFPRGRELGALTIIDRVVLDRLEHLHCHPVEGNILVVAASMKRRFDNMGKRGSSKDIPFTPPLNLIPEGGNTRRAICPEWSPVGTPAYDERLSIDDAIIEPLRAATKVARAELLDSFERGARELPGDAWIAGQRTRFAVEQRDTAAAIRAVRECGAIRWWCLALGGYARYANGDAAKADSLFDLSLAAMTPRERCDWTDVGVLLDESARRSYSARSCADRDSIAARVWWLADPLYSEPGNERRAEHFVRLLTIALHRAVAPSERWNWNEGDGGRALAEMITRYGWPSQTWWFGETEDYAHAFGFLDVTDQETLDAAIFTTAEYSPLRYHTFAEWSAVIDPWHAPATAWAFAHPRDIAGHLDTSWWPREHYARDAGGLMQIVEQQTAILRRRDDLELAIATDLARVDFGAGARTATGALVVTPAPDVIRLARLSVSLDSTAIFRATIPSQPAIVGVEVQPGHRGAPAARTRFGIDPVPPLSAMRAGEIAVSDPVLLRPPSAGETPDSDPSGALARMLGSTRVRGMDRIGIYWETYGVAAGERVEVSVQIERRGGPNALRRLGNALHLADGVESSATIRWREPQPGISAVTFDGPVPIQSRNISINLSRLEPDMYNVAVRVTRASGQTVSASREFEIVRR